MKYIDLFYQKDSLFLAKIVMYDSKLREVLNTLKSWNEGVKSSIVLRESEHIIGVRGRTHE